MQRRRGATANRERGQRPQPERGRQGDGQQLAQVGGDPIARLAAEGVDVERIAEKAGPPEVAYDPENPLADADGYVTRPKVDLTEEMTNIMMASRLYQANLSVMQQARDSYQQALRIGQQ